jgi:L-alanine-DL-glutamate epimerase-like enolase superfamily enzyme
MPLERLNIYQISTPLSRPYCLSFGVVKRFDSFIALAKLTDGTCRVGESTPLPGYNHETAELLAREYSLLERHANIQAFLHRNRAQPFVTAPILTCLDPTLDRRLETRDGKLQTRAQDHVALCPILQWDDPAEIAAAAHALAAQGNKVAKVKLTANLDETQRVVRETIRAGKECGMRFRYDANGALDGRAAETVALWLDDATTELLEQPFAASAWQEMASFYTSCPVPLMLDESIVDAEDIFRAAACADYIKLKLAKNGSPARLLEFIRQARECGLKVILGNGVQGEIGCWLEGQVQLLAGLTNAGEMNGFRKLRDNFLSGFVDPTSTGFTLGAGLPWPDLERALRDHCLREYHIPTGGMAASCA